MTCVTCDTGVVVCDNFSQHESDEPLSSFHQNVVVSDIDMNDISCNQLTAAAIKHLKSGKDYIAIPHDSFPVNEYDDENLFPLLYPSLFPFSSGGFY